MANRSLQITDSLYDYLLRHSLREPAILRELREETAKDSMANMQIAPEQGQFMQLLIKMLGVQNMIEVGVYTGYSSLCCALALPAHGRLIACDINEQWTSIAQRYWGRAGVADRIELRLAPALETLDELIQQGGTGQYDFVFIDADKANYLPYYERALCLLRTGGVIAIDNILWGGSVADDTITDVDTTAIREFNKALHADKRVDISLLPVADGLTLARKKDLI
jgi:predicted O-methyltransferase YrrM